MTNYISKINLNNAEYELKDHAARQMIEGLAPGFKTIIASTLPSASKEYLNTLVLVNDLAKSGTYVEYICYEASKDTYAFEKIGTTKTDLSEYIQFTDLTPITIKTVKPTASISDNTLMLDFTQTETYNVFQVAKK